MVQNKMLAVVAGALALCSSSVWAQEAGAVAASSATSSPKGFAAPTIEAPVGFGAGWGAIGTGVFAQTLGNSSDGSAGVTIGLGDPNEYVGLETSAVFSSLTGSHGSGDSFAKDGTLAFKLHTNLPDNAAIGVGVVGAAEWGSKNFKDANSSSVYAAATKAFKVDGFVMILNGGIGNNVFNRPQHTDLGVFGSGAFYITHWLSVIGEYSGRFTNAGISIAPLPMYLPLTITLGALNIGGKYGGDTEFGGSVGIGYNFK